MVSAPAQAITAHAWQRLAHLHKVLLMVGVPAQHCAHGCQMVGAPAHVRPPSTAPPTHTHTHACQRVSIPAQSPPAQHFTCLPRVRTHTAASTPTQVYPLCAAYSPAMNRMRARARAPFSTHAHAYQSVSAPPQCVRPALHTHAYPNSYNDSPLPSQWWVVDFVQLRYFPQKGWFPFRTHPEKGTLQTKADGSKFFLFSCRYPKSRLGFEEPHGNKACYKAPRHSETPMFGQEGCSAFPPRH